MAVKINSVFTLQYAAAITGCITVAGYGTISSWASPALPYLKSEESGIKITTDQGSWIASLYTLGFIIGFLLNPLLVDRLNRKWTLILFAFPQIFSWILIILAKSHVALYIARIIGGIGYGGGICAMTVYMTEIGNKTNRGIFFVLIRLSMGIGIFFTMLLGAYVTYTQMNYILVMFPVSFVAIFLFMPDSSYFLEINKKIEGEELRRMKTPGSEETAAGESKFDFEGEPKLGSMERSKNNSTRDPKTCNENSSAPKFPENKPRNLILRVINIFRKMSLLKLLEDSNNRKALVIVTLAGLINIFSGQVILSSFGQKILTHENAPIAPEKAMVLLSGTNVFACLISTLFIENIRRRTLLIFSGLVCALSLGTVGTFFFFENNENFVSYFSWVPILGLSVYDLLISIGPSNIFYIYQGEFFANDVKSVAVTVTKLIYIGFGFLTVLKFQSFWDIFGKHFYFWFCGSCCAFGTIVVYFIAPESQGKTLEEVQKSLERKRFFPKI